MDIKILFGLIAVVCEFAAAVIYYRDIYRGNTKPHLYTVIIWSLVMTVGFLGITVGGGEAGTWALALSTLVMVSLIPISLKWGTTDITNTDRIFLVLALITILPWILTKNPLWSVMLVALIDALGIIPTIRKTYNEPTSEALPAWILAVARSTCQIIALGAYTATTLMYPIELVIADGILVLVIIIRLRSAKKLKQVLFTLCLEAY